MRRVIILLSIAAFGILGTALVARLPEVFAEIKPAPSENEVVDTIIEQDIVFSHEGSFYVEAINVELTARDENAVIYYTTDGSDPTSESNEYTSPINIKAPKTARATTIKAITVSGGETSKIITKSYVTGADVFTRFDKNTLVFVLSTDPYNLYDYYYGVAIEGFLRDEYIKSDEYTGGQIDPPRPANYNMRGIESERDMYVEVFDNLGNKLIDQAAGARVVGGWSRASSQKSFRLFARNIYSEGNGMFKYPFFTGAVDSTGQAIVKYDRITLRNGGNDREQAGIRDELSLELAKQLGFPDTMEARPAAIFLNGRYYGFSWLKEAFCNGYLEQTYGGEKDNYQIVSNSERGDEGDEIAVADYKVLYDLALNAVENPSDETSFNNDEVFEEFCSLVDIDNLMTFYAMEVFIDNRDWPNNNIRAWRYYPSEDEAITNPYHDGKWRFMLFDAEFGWGLYGNGYSANTLKYILSESSPHMGGRSILLSAVLQREDMREKFAVTMCDLVSGPFGTDNVLETLNSLSAICANEQNFALDNGLMGWANRWTFMNNREQITEFAVARPSLVLSHIKAVFEIPDESEFYEVEITNDLGAEIYLNAQKTAESGKTLSGKYFDVYKVKIGVTPFIGYEFDYWEIGGERYYEKEMLLDKGLCGDDGKITVRLHLKEISEGLPLIISEIHAEGKEDWIELYNPNKKSVSTKGLYLTDNPAIPDRWSIPPVSIPAGQTLVITMKNNKSLSSLYKLQADFNLKEGETLILSDGNGEIMDRAVILATNEEESMTRKIDGTFEKKPMTPNEHSR